MKFALNFHGGPSLTSFAFFFLFLIVVCSIRKPVIYRPEKVVVFCYSLRHLLVLPMLVIAVTSPNFAHQHWEGKKTAKRPNNFDYGHLCLIV